MRRVLQAAAFFMIFVSALLTIIDCLCFARPFYAYEYGRDNTAQKIGMTDEGLMNATNTLLDYLRDERKDIVVIETVNGKEREIFDQRETLHMADVKNLYRRARRVRSLAGLAGLFILLGLFYKAGKGQMKELPEGYRDGAVLMFLLVSFILIWCVVDFNQFWLQFHYIFFDNDLFLLDPSVSIMINMFPEVFFRDMVLAVIICFLAFMVLLWFFVKKLTGSRNA